VLRLKSTLVLDAGTESQLYVVYAVEGPIWYIEISDILWNKKICKDLHDNIGV
jgi:hypothetical protein